MKIFNLADQERDTYDSKAREEKEKLSEVEVREHWKMRAKRPDVQSVMSARHTLEENLRATDELKRAIFEFLGDLVDGKRIFELGVGIGRMTGELARRAREVVGIDMTSEMLGRARENLKSFRNVVLKLGKVTELKIPRKSFDLIFESIVLLHILNPQELRATIKKMQELSDMIFIAEHTYEGPDFPVSKYSILRKPEEYEELFLPYQLARKQIVFCAGDTFSLMLFRAPPKRKDTGRAVLN